MSSEKPNVKTIYYNNNSSVQNGSNYDDVMNIPSPVPVVKIPTNPDEHGVEHEERVFVHPSRNLPIYDASPSGGQAHHKRPTDVNVVMQGGGKGDNLEEATTDIKKRTESDNEEEEENLRKIEDQSLPKDIQKNENDMDDMHDMHDNDDDRDDDKRSTSSRNSLCSLTTEDLFKLDPMYFRLTKFLAHDGVNIAEIFIGVKKELQNLNEQLRLMNSKETNTNDDE